MKPAVYILVILLLMLGIGAYNSGETVDAGFRYNDKENMELLIKELDSAGIRYRIDNNGFIRYSPQEKELKSAGVKFVVDRKGHIAFPKEDQPRFEKINDKVRRLLYGGNRIKANDQSKREEVLKVLKREGVEYVIQNRKDGIWGRWFPKDEQQMEKIKKKLGIFCSDKRKGKGEDKKASRPTPLSQMTLNPGSQKSCAS